MDASVAILEQGANEFQWEEVNGMQECEETKKKWERKERSSLSLSWEENDLSRLAKIVKKARQFIRRTTIEIGPAYDRLRMSRKHVVERWRRKKRELEKKK